MDSEKIDFIDLEVHQTKDIKDQHVNGSLTVIWRNWDKILKNEPKMIYVTSINPGEIKGPHLHKKRTSYFVCIKGKIVFIIQDKNGSYQEIISSEEKPVLVQVPNMFSSAHVNLSNTTSSVLTLADVAWKSGDDEMENVIFDNYDWKKWKNNF